jgi:hypothetical protein
MRAVLKVVIFLSLSTAVLNLIFSLMLKPSQQSSSNFPICGRYPHSEDIFTDNLIWQVLETSFGFVYLFNAYLDSRWDKTVVRVMVIGAEKNITNAKFFCQLWYDEKSPPFVVEASEIQKTWFSSEF